MKDKKLGVLLIVRVGRERIPPVLERRSIVEFRASSLSLRDWEVFLCYVYEDIWLHQGVWVHEGWLLVQGHSATESPTSVVEVADWLLFQGNLLNNSSLVRRRVSEAHPLSMGFLESGFLWVFQIEKCRSLRYCCQFSFAPSRGGRGRSRVSGPNDTSFPI